MASRLTPMTGDPYPRSGHRNGYKPISDYGIIGDLNTASLVGCDGSIDWCCLPRFDSASTFAALLDERRGGRFSITPVGAYASEQRYLPGTTVLVTTFSLAAGGTIELTDFMPITAGNAVRNAEIHRRVRCVSGEGEVRIHFAPRFNYAVGDPVLRPRWHGVLATDADDEVLTLSAPRDIWWEVDGCAAAATLKLRQGELVWLVVRYDDDEVLPVVAYESDERFAATRVFWGQWAARIQYQGEYREEVERSALTLKLLCYEPTGAIIAAPTTSLPEELGGTRNWDYRYAWLRDAGFVIYSLNVLGQQNEADRWMRFLKRVCRKATDTHLQILYGINGERDLAERSLEHLEGYRGSAPVRVGNGAHDQLQLDVYGEVLETAYIWSRHHGMSEGAWGTLEPLVDWVAGNWRRADNGIWEVRAGLQHYVFSKVMCWVALDRGVKLAEEFSLAASLELWRKERDAIHADVMEKGWSEKKQSFVQYYGTEELDASNLLIPMVRFLPRTHPRVKGTVHGVLRELTSEDATMVYRYRGDDGLSGEEGVFSICTFWLAQALIMCGEIERGERIFRRMLQRANHLGLYSEELNPVTGDFLGNFPQAFTHIALINCAHVLDVLKKREGA